jgi:hypothetical protein
MIDSSRACLTALIVAIGLTVASAAPPASPRSQSQPAPLNPESTDRLREGTKLESVQGAFKATGDRWTFVTADGTRRFGVLENLALERVERTIRENSLAVEWSVSGVITEHLGVNYLLVTRAALKTRVRQP